MSLLPRDMVINQFMYNFTHSGVVIRHCVFLFANIYHNGTIMLMSGSLSLLETIKESDVVLIGIGEEFECGMRVLESSSIYNTFLHKLEAEGLKEEAFEWMYPLMLCYALKNENVAKNIFSAYKKLNDIVRDKNYYFITMNMDPAIYYSELNGNRTVAPFGSYLRLQCDDACHNTLYNGEDYINGVCELLLRPEVKISSILQEICDKCDGHLVPNTINASKYIEAGYLPDWGVYQKWLQGTVNKKVCLLELGVTMQYPSIIREAFERICRYNMKSKMFRIGLLFPALPEDIAERAVSIQENSVEYINNSF